MITSQIQSIPTILEFMLVVHASFLTSLGVVKQFGWLTFNVINGQFDAKQNLSSKIKL
jgi:hypothetical protein